MNLETAVPERFMKPMPSALGADIVPPKLLLRSAALFGGGPASGSSAIKTFSDLLVGQAVAEVRAALARDVRAAALERALERAAGAAKEGGEAFPASPRQIYLADLRQGRAPSWHAAEALALAADLPAVAARHNRGLLERELERRRAEIAVEVCAESVLLRSLPPEGRDKVLAALGVRPCGNGAGPREEKPDPVPAARYRIVLSPLRRGEDGPGPDPEVLSLFEEAQAAFEANGDGRRGGRRRAEALVRGMLAPGVRAARVFGSSGNGSGPESIRGRRPRAGGVPLAVTKSMRADGSGAWIIEEDWVTPLDAAWEADGRKPDAGAVPHKTTGPETRSARRPGCPCRCVRSCDDCEESDAGRCAGCPKAPCEECPANRNGGPLRRPARESRPSEV